MAQEAGLGGGRDRSRKRGSGSRPRRWRVVGRGFDRASAVVAAGLVVWSLAWVFGGVSWWADIAANFAAQGAIVCVVAALGWGLVRRRKLCAVAVVALGLNVWVIGTGRAAFMPRAILVGAARDAGTVRMLHHNSSTKPEPAAVYGLIAGAAADIVSITEPNVSLQFEVIYGDALTAEYPYRILREFRQRPSGDRGAGFVLSKFPLTRFDVEPDAQGEHVEEIIAAVVDGPERFGLIAVHPRSPRTSARWADGHELTRAVAGVARRMRAEGLGVVVLADLNSTPTGWRSRELFFVAGLRRAKPVLEMSGTYPTRAEAGSQASMSLHWPLTIAIDDAFVGGPMELRGWGLLDHGGSDHWPVLVEVVPGK